MEGSGFRVYGSGFCESGSSAPLATPLVAVGSTMGFAAVARHEVTLSAEPGDGRRLENVTDVTGEAPLARARLLASVADGLHALLKFEVRGGRWVWSLGLRA
jgi:hypothetical protein